MIMKFVPVALAPLLLIAAPAEAAPVRFHYSAGELASAAGAQMLYARLSQRVEMACTANGNRGLWLRRTEERCNEALLTDFIDRIGDSGLASVHAQASAGRLLATRD